MNLIQPTDDTRDPLLRFSPVLYGFLGNCLLYTCLPPLGWSWMAWLAPACWIPLVAVNHPDRNGQPAKGTYFSLYLFHVLFWLALLQGMRLAHWTTYFGWVALSLYLGIYLPLFVMSARVIRHQLQLPLSWAAAISWVCVEWIRGYVISGFSMGSLSHSQVNQLWLIQIADLGGGFAVSFVVVLGAGLLFRIASRVNQWRRPDRPPGYQANSTVALMIETVCLVCILSTCWVYGQTQLNRFNESSNDTRATVSVGLIQGVTYTEFELPYDEYERKEQKKQQTYNQQSVLALREEPRLQLLVWPESMYPVGPLMITGKADTVLHVPAQPAGAAQDQQQIRQWATRVQTGQARSHKTVLSYLNDHQHGNGAGKAMLIGGTSSVDLTKPNTPSYNTAVLLSPEGEILDVYHKNHLVMFGEYIPLGNLFPALYNLLPISPLAAGDTDMTFSIDGITFSPNICFESTVPHRTREMILAVGHNGRRPDVILNLTNDGWFWGSSMLDLHFRSNIMRAVELRRPNLIAANTGISGWVAPSGAVNAQVEKTQAGFVIAKVGRSSGDSFYLLYGDLFAMLCGLITLISLGKALIANLSAESNAKQKSN